MDFAGCSVAGEQELGRSEGYNRFTFPDGTQYFGNMSHGLFHTVDEEGGEQIGTVYFPASLGSGRVKAVWENGVPRNRNFFSEDGLAYVEGKWHYCTDDDRRLWHERRTFIIPPTLYGIRDPNTIIPDLTPVDGGEDGDLDTAPDDARRVFLTAVANDQIVFDSAHVPDMLERTIPSLVVHDTSRPALPTTIPPDLIAAARDAANDATAVGSKAAFVRAAVADGLLPTNTPEGAAAAALAPPPGLAAWCSAAAVAAGVPTPDVPEVIACVRRNPVPLTAALLASPADAPAAVRAAAVGAGLPAVIADGLAAAAAAGTFPGSVVAESLRVGVAPVACVDVFEGVPGAPAGSAADRAGALAVARCGDGAAAPPTPAAGGAAVALPRRTRPGSAASGITSVTVAAFLQGGMGSPTIHRTAPHNGDSLAQSGHTAVGAGALGGGLAVGRRPSHGSSVAGASTVVTNATMAARAPH